MDKIRPYKEMSQKLGILIATNSTEMPAKRGRAEGERDRQAEG